MTVGEQRFMEMVPHVLMDIARELKRIADLKEKELESRGIVKEGN